MALTKALVLLCLLVVRWQHAEATTKNGLVTENESTTAGTNASLFIESTELPELPNLRGAAEMRATRGIGFVDDPEAEEMRAEEAGSFSWKPCSSTYYPCRNGYRMASACVSSFLYNGNQYDECAPSVIGGTPWCSSDSTYSYWWKSGQRCLPCTEQSELPEDTVWKALAQDFACTPIVITGGSIARGQRDFTFINGFTPIEAQARFPAFSGGKWPGTVAIAGAVHSGHLSWDTRAADVFDWWTSDARDPKSRVTLRNLLQFSSGFYSPFRAMGHAQIPCMRMSNMWRDVTTTMEDCAKEVYEKASFSEKRLGAWPDNLNYNSLHQVVALAMATKRTGLIPSDYLKKYLYDPAGMTQTSVHPLVRPILSAFMVTTVDDYDSFLSKYLTYQILPKEIVDVMEADSGNAAGSWINAMGHHTAGALHDWGGSLYASVDRETETYQLIAPPVKEYPGGAWGKWEVVHGLIERLIEHISAPRRRLASSFV